MALQQRAIAALEEASARGVDVASDAYPWLAGSTALTQVLPQAALDGDADERANTPEDVVMDILLEQRGNVNIVEHCHSLESLRALITHPLATVITDGVYTRGRSHPRLYATLPLLLRDLVRERKWLSLEAAVHKVTDKPAAAFHMDGRGRISEGYVADITSVRSRSDPYARHLREA